MAPPHLPVKLSALTQIDIGRLKLILVGAPGVGKGTFANLLTRDFKTKVLAVGDLVRSEIKGNTKLGQNFKEYSSAGKLVPDDLINEMVFNHLENIGALEPKEGLIFDGYPRTKQQAAYLESKGVDNVILAILEQPEDIILAKIAGRRVCDECKSTFNIATIDQGEYKMAPLLPTPEQLAACAGCRKLTLRSDDAPETALQRMQEYRNETMPLIEHYSRTGRVVHFNVYSGVADYPRFVSLLGAAAAVTGAI